MAQQGREAQEAGLGHLEVVSPRGCAVRAEVSGPDITRQVSQEEGDPPARAGPCGVS